MFCQLCSFDKALFPIFRDPISCICAEDMAIAYRCSKLSRWKQRHSQTLATNLTSRPPLLPLGFKLALSAALCCSSCQLANPMPRQAKSVNSLSFYQMSSLPGRNGQRRRFSDDQLHINQKAQTGVICFTTISACVSRCDCCKT